MVVVIVVVVVVIVVTIPFIVVIAVPAIVSVVILAIVVVPPIVVMHESPRDTDVQREAVGGGRLLRQAENARAGEQAGYRDEGEALGHGFLPKIEHFT
jgi:hypothetical protein